MQTDMIPPKEQLEMFYKWRETLPAGSKELAMKFPPDRAYRMTADAPYGVSCPGTKVYMHSYHEDGKTLTVIVLAIDKLPAALQHEKELCEKHKKISVEQAHAQNVMVNVEAKYVEEYTV